MQTLSSEFFKKNRERIFQNIPQNSVAFVVSADELPRSGDQTFKYRQNPYLYYLTGINQEQTILVLNPSHPNEKNREMLFIRNASKLEQIWEGNKLTVEQAKEISGIENINFISNFDSILGDLTFYADEFYISTNENLKYNRFYNDADFRFIEKLKYRFPLHKLNRLSPIIIKNRLIKSKEEIEIIKKSINITKDAFLRVLKFIKPAIGEYEIEAEITHEFIRQQAYNHAYLPIVASGKDNNILHYTENNKICKSGELVLMDFGAEYQNYAADLSRTVPVNGVFDDFQRRVYNSVLFVQNEAKKLMKPGMTINKWNKEVAKIMENQLLEIGLLKTNDIKNQNDNWPAYKKYFMHGTGHFMGLDVHDVGTNDTPWKTGMILTNEPGIYIEEKGFGIRLENDILITENGNLDLMAHIPIIAEEIEELMHTK